ncbi:DNA/RNA non-specific endonuclease [Actinomyces procaprae]|uniref:DNA/RNA non-specific endonuclease n=1 Tax=Actinomyces procaprae TaxID=2560010 RepID=UPI003B8359D9
MNPDLRDPLPSATYTVDGKFDYTTDEWGRTVRLQVDRLDWVPEDARYRSESAQKRIGHYGDGLGGGYAGGHLAGAEYGGRPEDINVWPMLKERNRGIGDTYAESFKALEDANSEESRRLPQYRHPYRVRRPTRQRRLRHQTGGREPNRQSANTMDGRFAGCQWGSKKTANI